MWGARGEMPPSDDNEINEVEEELKYLGESGPLEGDSSTETASTCDPIEASVAVREKLKLLLDCGRDSQLLCDCITEILSFESTSLSSDDVTVLTINEEAIQNILFLIRTSEKDPKREQLITLTALLLNRLHSWRISLPSERDLIKAGVCELFLSASSYPEIKTSCDLLIRLLKGDNMIIQSLISNGILDKCFQVLSPDVTTDQGSLLYLLSLLILYSDIALAAFNARPSLVLFLSMLQVGSICRSEIISGNPIISLSVSIILNRLSKQKTLTVGANVVQTLCDIISCSSLLSKSDFFESKNWDSALCEAAVETALTCVRRTIIGSIDLYIENGIKCFVVVLGECPSLVGICEITLQILSCLLKYPSVNETKGIISDQNKELFGSVMCTNLCRVCAKLILSDGFDINNEDYPVELLIRILRTFSLGGRLTISTPDISSSFFDVIISLRDVYQVNSPVATIKLTRLFIESILYWSSEATQQLDNNLNPEDNNIIKGTSHQLNEAVIKTNAAISIQKLWRGHHGRSKSKLWLKAAAECHMKKITMENEHYEGALWLNDTQYTDRCNIISDFEGEWTTLIKSHQTITTERAAIDIEIRERERLAIERTATQYFHNDESRALITKHESLMNRSLQHQSLEEQEIDDEIKDIQILPNPSERQQLMNIVTNRQHTLSQNNARIRLRLRTNMAAERDSLNQKHDEQLSHISEFYTTQRDSLTIELLEERSRGYGKVDRHWWKGKGIVEEETRQWEILQIAMEMKWIVPSCEHFYEVYSNNCIYLITKIIKECVSIAYDMSAESISKTEAVGRLHITADEHFDYFRKLKYLTILCKMKFNEINLRFELLHEELEDTEIALRQQLEIQQQTISEDLVKTSSLVGKRNSEAQQVILADEQDDRFCFVGEWIQLLQHQWTEWIKQGFMEQFKQTLRFEQTIRSGLARQEVGAWHTLHSSETDQYVASELHRLFREISEMETTARNDLQNSDIQLRSSILESHQTLLPLIMKSNNESAEFASRQTFLLEETCYIISLWKSFTTLGFLLRHKETRQKIFSDETSIFSSFNNLFYVGYNMVLRGRQALVERTARRLTIRKEEDHRSVLQQTIRNQLMLGMKSFGRLIREREEISSRRCILFDEVINTSIIRGQLQSNLMKSSIGGIVFEEQNSRITTTSLLASSLFSLQQNFISDSESLCRMSITIFYNVEMNEILQLEQSEFNLVYTKYLSEEESMKRDWLDDKSSVIFSTIQLGFMKQLETVLLKEQRIQLQLTESDSRLEIEAHSVHIYIELTTKKIKDKNFITIHLLKTSEEQARDIVLFLYWEEIYCSRQVLFISNHNESNQLIQRREQREIRYHWDTLQLAVFYSRCYCVSAEENQLRSDIELLEEPFRDGFVNLICENDKLIKINLLQRFVRLGLSSKKLLRRRREIDISYQLEDIAEERHHINENAITIQRFIPFIKSRQVFICQLNKKNREAAIVFQSLCRRWVAQKQVRFLRRKRNYLIKRQLFKENNSAQLIQWAWREQKARVLAVEYQKMISELKILNYNATEIQRCIRGYLGRKTAIQVRYNRDTLMSLIIQRFCKSKQSKITTRRIQCQHINNNRSVLTRQVMDVNFDSLVLSHAIQRCRAASTVQRAFRFYRASVIYVFKIKQQSILEEYFIKENSATCIQRRFRGMQSRRFVNQLKEEQLYKLEQETIQKQQNACIAIQRIGKGMTNRQFFHQTLTTEIKAAIVIQCWRRVIHSRSVASFLRIKSKTNLLYEERLSAVSLLQHVSRGYKYRSCVLYPLYEAYQYKLQRYNTSVELLYRVQLGYKSRFLLYKNLIKRNSSVECLQRATRCHRSRNEVAIRSSQKEQENRNRMQWNGSIVIQCAWRWRSLKKISAAYRIQETWKRVKERVKQQSQITSSKLKIYSMERRVLYRTESAARFEIVSSEDDGFTVLLKEELPSWDDKTHISVLVRTIPIKCKTLLSQEKASRIEIEHETVKSLKKHAIVSNDLRNLIGTQIINQKLLSIERDSVIVMMRHQQVGLQELRNLKLRFARVRKTLNREQKRNLQQEYLSGRESIMISATLNWKEVFKDILVATPYKCLTSSHTRRKSIKLPPEARTNAAIAITTRCQERGKTSMLGDLFQQEGLPLPTSHVSLLSVPKKYKDNKVSEIRTLLPQPKLCEIEALATTIQQGSVSDRRAQIINGNYKASTLTLSLSGIPIGDDGMKILLKGFADRDCWVVESLYLKETNISDLVMEDFADTLRVNTSLTSISLVGNINITDDGIDVLISALRYNKTLLFVDVSQTSVTPFKKNVLLQNLASTSRHTIQTDEESNDMNATCPLPRKSSFIPAVDLSVTYSGSSARMAGANMFPGKLKPLDCWDTSDY